MDTVINWILGILTLIGGMAAIGYFVDKWRAKRRWTEEDKIVNNGWWETSELKGQLETSGYSNFGWSNPNRLAELLAAGKEIVYEIDAKKRIKHRIINSSGQILVCRRNA